MNKEDKMEVKMLVAVGYCRMDFQKLGTYVERSLRNLHEPFFKKVLNYAKETCKT